MSDASGSDCGLQDRIVQAVVGELVFQRQVPSVFMLDERSNVIAWSSSADSCLPASLLPLVDMYFAQPVSTRVSLAEQIAIGGQAAMVRIGAYHAFERTLYALIVEPLDVRSDVGPEAGEQLASAG